MEVDLYDKIIEYLWRREVKKTGADAFAKLLDAIRNVGELAEAAGPSNRYDFYTN